VAQGVDSSRTPNRPPGSIPPYRDARHRIEETHTNGTAPRTYRRLTAGLLLLSLLSALLSTSTASAAATIYCLKKNGHHVVVTKCPKAAAGPRGITGSAGAAGTAGLAAPAGVTGAAGSNGATGAAGSSTGVTGPAGASGAAGVTGAAGATGTPGAIGATGSIGATGTAGAVGGTGSTGTVGSTEEAVGLGNTIPPTGELLVGHTVTDGAECAGSKVPIGGGGKVEPTGNAVGAIEASYPIEKEWKAVGIVTSTLGHEGKLKVTAYAICAEP
jgi:hypothetical protein